MFHLVKILDWWQWFHLSDRFRPEMQTDLGDIQVIDVTSDHNLYT